MKQPSQVKALFAEVAAALGIPGIVHTDDRSTRAEFAALGLYRDSETEGQK